MTAATTTASIVSPATNICHCCDFTCKRNNPLSSTTENILFKHSKFEKQQCIGQNLTRKKRKVEHNPLPTIDIFLDPERKPSKYELKSDILKSMKTYFKSPKFQKSYPALFKLLWHSALPCSPIPGISTHAILKKCEWAGQAVDCSKLFEPVPTDSGMCCAFNSVRALRNSTYSRLLEQMKGKTDKLLSGESVKKARVGKQNGLRVVLDQHSNQKSFGTLSKDFNALQFYVGGSAEFPLIKDRGFFLDPGQEHFIEMSAISVTANPDIREINPNQRNCYFSSENPLPYHSQYTYSSCKLEAGLSSAVEKLNCTPWYLPTDPELEGDVCDPWRAMEFTREMASVNAAQCLPDCQGNKYSIQRSSAMFRS